MKCVAGLKFEIPIFLQKIIFYLSTGVKGRAQGHLSNGNEEGASTVFFTFPSQIYAANLLATSFCF